MARPAATRPNRHEGTQGEWNSVCSRGLIFAIAIAYSWPCTLLLRAPLPLAFIVVAVVTALIGDFGIPFRHLVEGGFGFINLVLALFAGAFFGHMMRASGAADAAAAGIVRA